MRPFGAEYGFSRKWGPWSSRYIRALGIVDLATRIRAQELLEALPSGHLNSALDFGAGTGVYSFFLSRRGMERVVAIDVDAGRVAEINRTASMLGLHSLSAVADSDACFSKLKGSDFSLILAVEVLQYLRNLTETLAKARDCLAENGILLAHVPLRGSLAPYEHHLFSESSVMSTFQNAGFRSVEMRRTFGWSSVWLCDLFERVARRRWVVALLFPVLLLAARLVAVHPKNGRGLLVIARNTS